MKTITSLVSALALLGGSLAAQAADPPEHEFSQCLVELRAHYGAGIEMKLVDRRRTPRGTRLRIAAQHGADSAEFATCWLFHGDVVAVQPAERPALAAAAAVAAAP